MGGKRAWERVEFCLCVAGLALVVASGCALIGGLQAGSGAREALSRGKELLSRGDYDGALKENEKVLTLFPGGYPGDEAIFFSGLIYAHADNPKRDYHKALSYFRSLVRHYPRSPFLEQAKIWIGVLEAHDRLAQENKKYKTIIEDAKKIDIEIEELRRKRER